jgi:hypothetical protein
MAESPLRSRTSSLVLPLALFLFLLAVYLLTYSPQFHSSDGLAMFATAESLVRRGEWDADQIRWMGLGQGIFGPDGHLYIRKGIGVSLLALPLVWLGIIVPIWGAVTATLLFNALVTAASGALVLLYVRELGYENRVTLVAGLIFGLATPAWPYAKTFFSDPLAGLCLVGAALALLRFRKRGRAVQAFWAGLALAVAVAARYANAVLVPLYGLLLIKYQVSNFKLQRASSKSRGWRAWVAFGMPLVVTAIAIAYYNLARYGDPFNTGYLPEESFSGVWPQGIAGLLISPGRGLFLYAPVLLITLAAAPVFFRRHRSEAVLTWAVILLHLLLYGKWFMWHGGYAWGPRFMIPTLPLFTIGMAPAIERARERGWWRIGFLALAFLSGLIQILGLSVDFELFQTRLLDTGLPLFAPITFFDVRYSPLLGQFQFLRPEYLDFIWITSSQVDWPLLLALTIAALLSGWGLWRSGRMEDRKTGRPEDWREGPVFQSASHPTFHPSILVSFSAILMVTTWLLIRAHALQPGDLREAVAVLNTHTSAADAVVTGTPDESPAFSDLYKGRANVLGLSAGAPFDADTEAALSALTMQHPRLWWLPNWLPPEDIGIERWLMRHGFRVEERTFSTQRLVLFFFPPQPLMETQIGAVLGDAILLERVGTLPAVQPGGVLPVALRWEARYPVSADYYVFVHLLDAEENRVAQSDGQPALWTRPTSSWAPGEPIEDRYALRLPADLLPGDYTLIAGLYLPNSGERLLTDSGQTYVTLATVQIRE